MKKLLFTVLLLLGAATLHAQIDEAALLDMINQLRADGCDCGNRPVRPTSEVHWNAELAETAKSYAEYLEENNNELVVGQHMFLRHVGLDGSTLEDRLRDGGVTARYAVENLACIESDKEVMVMDHWLNNPESCLHLMDRDVNIAGAGRSGRFWVLILAQTTVNKEKEQYK